MKKLIIILTVFISFTACSQKKKDNMNTNKALNIYKEVKKFDYNPRYWLDIKASDCTYEILVNGMPLSIYYDKASNSQVSIPLNTRILKSGVQKLSIKIYPPLDNSFNFKESLIESSSVSIKISYGEFGKEKAADYKKVLEYKTPEMRLPYYETELSFNATVPYQLSGWEKSVDLSHEKEEDLEKEVIKKYQEFIKLYDGKENDAVLEKYYQREKEIAQSLFLNKESDSREAVNKIEKDINKGIPFKLEKYTMKIYADGKVVALVRNDKYYRGLSAFFCQDENRYSSYSLLLHRPKPGFPLEVIR